MRSVVIVGLLVGVCAMIGACSAAAQEIEPGVMEHPVTRFQGGDEVKLRTSAARIKGQSVAALKEFYLKKEVEGWPKASNYYNAVRAAIGLWESTGDKQYRDDAVRACEAALGDALAAPVETLCARVSDLGGRDEQNFLMRDVCYQFALLYYATKDKAYARKSATLLARFAEMIPTWKIYTPHWGPWEERTPHPQDWPGLKQGADTISGFWGLWLYFDIQNSFPLLEAYDLLYNAGVMQEAGTLKPTEKMLRGHVELVMKFGPFLSNLDKGQMEGILAFAKILGEPEWVHHCVQWVKNLYKTQFYADAWWHEGTVAYHQQIGSGMRWLVETQLQGYSDPKGFRSKLDGTRFDNLDMNAMMARQFQRVLDVRLATRQPNKTHQAIHDTGFPMPAWLPEMKEAKSYLFGCAGHAILGTGNGPENMAQASLHFGGSHGHEHLDCLNLILFAKGRELISETQYRDVGASTREWHTMTAGHVTVVVDEQSQNGRAMRTRQPEDAIPGIPDWPWRWGNHGGTMNDGKLRLFNTDFDQVQVVEAEGERAYDPPGKVSLYRRTIAFVKVGESDCYVVDIFRVKGGKTHDYMLHSCLDFPYQLETSIPLDNRRKGSLHKYLTELRSARSDDAWSATFTLDDGKARLRTFVLPQKGTEIIRGTGPAMRRVGTAPFLVVRQSDGESTFVAVHHPYVDEPLVRKVELLEINPSSDRPIGIRVTLPERTDTILATMDEESPRLRQTTDGKIKFSGRFAHVAEGKQNWAYLVGGTRLCVGTAEIRGKVSHGGILTGTLRQEAGDACDAFVTRGDLPADGSLNGRTLVVDQGGLLVQSFRIARIERKGGQTLIHSQDEPGMTITPDLVKLEYFPGWGIRGTARFGIAGSALLRASDGDGWRFRASGEASATVDGKRIGQ